jgi:hypothetical protein
LKVLAIHGLGGVGKTQVALHYANVSLKLFDAITWILSETRMKMAQAVTTFATKLGILKAEAEAKEDEMQAVLKMKDWLNNFGCRFPLIFDNVESIDILLSL